MLFFRLRIYQNIIQEDNDKLIQVILEYTLLALKVTLRLREDKPNTHHSFWWMLVLYEWGSMDKIQYMNDVQHKTKQEMHREVRATTNFSQ
jgi:hypothetical protein